MLRMLPIVLLAVALAGCGGGSKDTQTTAPVTTVAPTTTAPADPGRDAAEALVAAAAAGKIDAIWGMLSVRSKQRLGPTLGEFRSGAGGKLADDLGSFRNVRVIVSERITPEFGVVAIDGRKHGKRAVYAVPLRLEGKRWKLELGSPVNVRPIGPLPGAHEPIVAQIAAAVTGPGGSGTAVMYLDGHTENPKVAGTTSNATMYANFDPALDPGRHTVVVFASDGGEAGAKAWDFTAGRSSG
jgi:hypothetical protein